MRIMNGNDSVVKCFCFFRFLSLPFFNRYSGSVTGVVLCGDSPADATASWWTAAGPFMGAHKCVHETRCRAQHCRRDAGGFVYAGGGPVPFKILTTGLSIKLRYWLDETVEPRLILTDQSGAAKMMKMH